MYLHQLIRHLVQVKIINTSSQLSYLPKATLQKKGAEQEGTECIKAGECLSFLVLILFINILATECIVIITLTSTVMNKQDKNLFTV